MVVNELDGMPILSYRESPLYGVGGITKRLLDILGALAAILLFGPLMLGVVLAVKLTSPGPVIFRQRRVSLGGQKFNIYKFRTMYHVDDERGEPATWTRRDDPRLQRWVAGCGGQASTSAAAVQRALRRDVAGGPALRASRADRSVPRGRRGYMLRQHAKAGITGWAQVNGLRGDTSLKKRLQYDLFYIRHWSLLFDLKILWLTVFRGFVHRNARSVAIPNKSSPESASTGKIARCPPRATITTTKRPVLSPLRGWFAARGWKPWRLFKRTPGPRTPGARAA